MIKCKPLNLVASPFLLFAMLSFFSVATQGVDTWSHLFYNLTPLNLIQNGFNKKVISIATNPESFEYHYYVAIVPWLKVAVISVIMAFIVRFISYCLIYQVCLACIREKNPAIVVTFLFMVPVAISAHGLNPNGLWGPPVLFPAILSTFFILIGLLLFLSTGEYNDLVDKARKKGVADFKWVFKNEGIRYVLAGFAFAFSIQFHGLYGTTAFAWLFISALLILASRGWRNWSWFFVEFLIVVLGVVYVAYLTFESNSSAHINLGEWYRFINSLEYDDISLLFSLEYGGYGFLPLIFSGAYFAFKTKEKTDIEHLQLGLFYTFLIFIIIEVLHYNGAFFGKVSEYFIAAQLRRGVWIAVLVSLIILAKNYRIIQDGIHEKHRMLLVALGVTTFSAPSVGTVILFFSVAVFAAAQPKKRFVYFLLAVSIVGSLIHVCNRYVNIAIEVKSIILLITSVFVLYLLKRMNRDSIRSVVSSISSLVVIAFFCSGLYQEKFLKSFKKLHSIEKNDYSQFLSSFDKYYDPKTISCIKENTMDNDAINATQKIQLPLVGVRWYTESLYNQEFFISPRGIKGWQFSTFIYENSLKKIYLLFGKSAYNRIFDSLGKFPFAKENLDNRFMMEYETMSKDHLKSIRNKVGVRFYLVERKRNELSQALLCVGNLFHVYDLTKLG